MLCQPESFVIYSDLWMIKLPSIMRILRKNIWNIYPTELELKKENQINRNSNFLNLGIKIQNSRFQQKFTIKETILILI